MNTTNIKKSFALCMSVYKNDNPADFITAYRSVTDNQTIKPSETILVIDGPIPDTLNTAIQQVEQSTCVPLRIIRFDVNKGHAIARQTAIEAAKNDFIAIMDSDDIATPERFEKQINYLEHHPEVDVVGGQIFEFIGDVSNIVGKREVPMEDKDIKTYLKSRCPMNFVTVMVKRASVQSVGGLIDWYCEEDYYLWIRMAINNCTFANLPDVIVNVRCGEGMYQRRGGWKYFKSERGIQQFMLTHHLISVPRYCYNVLGRFVVQVLMSNKVRGIIFQKIFRK